jgi:hypothetical protein
MASLDHGAGVVGSHRCLPGTHVCKGPAKVPRDDPGLGSDESVSAASVPNRSGSDALPHSANDRPLVITP